MQDKTSPLNVILVIIVILLFFVDISLFLYKTNKIDFISSFQKHKKVKISVYDESNNQPYEIKFFDKDKNKFVREISIGDLLEKTYDMIILSDKGVILIVKDISINSTKNIPSNLSFKMMISEPKEKSNEKIVLYTPLITVEGLNNVIDYNYVEIILPKNKEVRCNAIYYCKNYSLLEKRCEKWESIPFNSILGSRQNKTHIILKVAKFSTWGAGGLVCDEGDLNTTCVINSSVTIPDGGSINGTGNLRIKDGGSLNSAPGDRFEINIGGWVRIDNGGNISGNVNITAQNLTIEEGAKIDATGKGYPGGNINSTGQGPGGGGYCSAGGDGCGGGYGGYGGRSYGCSCGGSPYGSLTQPTSFGSGGGGSSENRGGYGGGAIFINISDTLIVNGSIIANGETPPGGGYGGAGGGSGGSIWIITKNFIGKGTISAKGGDRGSGSYNEGGGGSGGRIAIYYVNNNFSGVFSVDGGSGYERGERGTIYPWNISISINLDKYTVNPEENITISGRAILEPDGSSVVNNTIGIWLDGKMWLNLVEGWNCKGECVNLHNQGWTYRKPITIQENSGNNLTDYQIPINITYAPHMQPDFDDVRFTYYNETSNKEIKIPYWIEQKVNSSWAYVWIKVPFIPANGTAKVYLYYGNQNAVSESNGSNVFEFFDDFEDEEIDVNKWNDNTGGYSISDSKITFNSGDGTWKYIKSVKSFQPEVILEYSIDYYGDWGGSGTKYDGFKGNTLGGTISYSLSGDNGPFVGFGEGIADWKETPGVGNGDSSTKINTGVNTAPQNVLTNHKAIIKWKVTKVNLYKKWGSTIYNDIFTSYIPTSEMNIIFGVRGNSDYPRRIYIDYVFVRKYADPEPTAIIGSEQPITSTDSQGNYNYTFKAPLEAGTHTIKVNLTNPNGIYGENSTTFIQQRIAIRNQKATFEYSGTEYIDADNLPVNPLINISAKVYKNIDNPIDSVWINIH